MKQRLLVVDDDDDIRTQMKWALSAAHEVVTAEDRAGALESLRAAPAAVVLLDLGLPPHPNDPTEGLAALSEIMAHDRLTKVIVITGQADKENALKAIEAGAYDFLCKPIEAEELAVILRRAFYVAALERECRDLQQKTPEQGFEGMLGNSSRIQALFTAIRKVATTDAPVLLLGESGTGKEMAAKALHRLSLRKDGPFVPINCGAIPENLLESELFGHEKGSFTGAHAQRVGHIETAEGGTLFLDEIGELSPPLQVKLLRFLQERTIERVGGRQKIEIDARVIAATNADLQQGLADGSFREDLYYRVAVLVLTLPPLREREGDILLLARAFLKQFAAESHASVTGFAAQAVRAMEVHPWPGNVREMENRVRRAVIMAEGPQVTGEDLELTTSTASGYHYTGLDIREAREVAERDVVQRALTRHGGKISRAATDLGISRPTLYELMEKLAIKRD